MKFSAQVDQYIAKKSKWPELLTLLREIVGASELDETIRWGTPTYTLNCKNILGLGAFKSFVALWFFQGALLNDPLKVLVNAQEGKTRALRQWRFTSTDEIIPSQVKAYINEAIKNQKQGRSIKPRAPAKKPLVN